LESWSNFKKRKEKNKKIKKGKMKQYLLVGQDPERPMELLCRRERKAPAASSE
jgi:hypothetical protein